MTKYLDVPAVCTLIHAMGVEATIAGMAEYITQDYLRWGDFKKSPRMASHVAEGVIEIMPISDDKLYSFKYVNGHPENTAKGLPTVMAFGVLAEMSTGMPLLLCEMTLLTALRTAATSAVAAKALARPNSTIMAVIGCGAQSEFQILAFKVLLNINIFRIYDVDAEAMTKVKDNLSRYQDLTIVEALCVDDAVKGADIITTLTAAKVKAAILTPDMIQPGMHINGVGGDCPGKTELHIDILKMARLVVEYKPQTLIEGEIQQLSSEVPIMELWEVLENTAAGRLQTTDITIFDSVGFALEDFSALRYVYDIARHAQVGENLNLIPSLTNPKDLFSLIKG